jgi:RNA polymerase sigma-54 factor
MALEQKLSLRLSQKLVMTPSLQQAIKLLQLTRMELETVLNQELVENPVLEEREETPEEPEQQATEDQPAEQKKDEVDHQEAMGDIDLEAYFNDYWESNSYQGQTVLGVPEAPPLENTLTRDPDLYDHLLWQLHMCGAPDNLRQLAELIVGNLDADGFLVASLEEIQEMGRVEEDGEPFPREDVERALQLVQSFDPPGVACHDLRESLLAQLDHQGEPHDSLAWRMIEQHWDLFLKRQFPAIARDLGVELHDLEPAVERVKNLETRPGRKFGTERAHYVEPDVAVIKIGEEYIIQLNDDGLPRLRVSKAYRRMLQEMKSNGREAEAHQFLRDKMRSAVWLIKSLDQRQRTIYKVASSIVRQQRSFLDHGIEHLRPMVLRDVAEDIGMHESTVSRVVSNKYIHTPRGLFPMKFFFHSGIDRDYGEDISSLTVKRKIQQLIQSEDAKRPLSDSALARLLHKEGIQIARRTVAKYRDELGIPSSTDRRQIF